jgi:uncharacterized peroxidase-related enzyme
MHKGTHSRITLDFRACLLLMNFLRIEELGRIARDDRYVGGGEIYSLEQGRATFGAARTRRITYVPRAARTHKSLQSCARPSEEQMAKKPWIECAPPEQATGDLRRAYDKILATRGSIPQIRAVMAGEPLTVEGFAWFYPENNYACRSIDRRLAEMIATVASAANGSGFGGPAHARQLARLTGDPAFADALLRDYTRVDLPRKERALLDYVWKLSRTPGEMSAEDLDVLRAEGWSDAQLVATVHVTAFFAYMNRVAEAFGVS